MKVHIVLKRDTAADPVARQVACDLLTALGLTNVSQKRLDRYGIVSGDVADEQFAALQKIDSVEAIQRDEMRFATSEADENPMPRREMPSRRPELGPSPTEGDEFFRRLSEGAKRAYP